MGCVHPSVLLHMVHLNNNNNNNIYMCKRKGICRQGGANGNTYMQHASLAIGYGGLKRCVAL